MKKIKFEDIFIWVAAVTVASFLTMIVFYLSGLALYFWGLNGLFATLIITILSTAIVLWKLR